MEKNYFIKLKLQKCAYLSNEENAGGIYVAVMTTRTRCWWQNLQCDKLRCGKMFPLKLKKKCLAQGHNILMSGFEHSNSVIRNRYDIYIHIFIYSTYILTTRPIYSKEAV